MKTLKAAISLLMLSSVSAIADDIGTSSMPDAPLPLITKMLSGEKPAVDGVNVKTDIYGGAAQSGKWGGFGGGLGTLAFPIGHAFAGQVDLDAGGYVKRPYGIAAGHLFWRDPDKGLIGLYASGTYGAGKIDHGIWQTGGEFQSYIGRFTGRVLVGLMGTTAYAGSLSNKQIHPPINNAFNFPNRIFDEASIKFYPIDDLAFAVGHMNYYGHNYVTGEIEFIPPQFRGSNIAPSVYGIAAYGWNNTSFAQLGVRIYFGNADRSLIRRHREETPHRSYFDSLDIHPHEQHSAHDNSGHDHGCDPENSAECDQASLDDYLN